MSIVYFPQDCRMVEVGRLVDSFERELRLAGVSVELFRDRLGLAALRLVMDTVRNVRTNGGHSLKKTLVVNPNVIGYVFHSDGLICDFSRLLALERELVQVRDELLADQRRQKRERDMMPAPVKQVDGGLPWYFMRDASSGSAAAEDDDSA